MMHRVQIRKFFQIYDTPSTRDHAFFRVIDLPFAPFDGLSISYKNVPAQEDVDIQLHEVWYYPQTNLWTAWDETWAPFAEECRASRRMSWAPDPEAVEKEIQELLAEGWTKADSMNAPEFPEPLQGPCPLCRDVDYEPVKVHVQSLHDPSTHVIEICSNCYARIKTS